MRPPTKLPAASFAGALFSNKLLAVAELDSDTGVAKLKRIRGKKRALTATGVLPPV